MKLPSILLNQKLLWQHLSLRNLQVSSMLHITWIVAMKYTFVLMISIFLALNGASAETILTPEQRQSLEEMQKVTNKQNFSGWKGVLIYCTDADKLLKSLKEICEKTYTNADFLATISKLDLVKAKSAYELAFRSVVDDFLVLEITLSATKQGMPTAIHASVRAYAHYSKAVDNSLNAQEKKGPRADPKSGDLVFWERVVIGASSGTDQELVIPISEGIEQLMKQFFIDYLNADR